MCRQPLRGRVGEQRGQVGARHQHVGGVPPRAQAVAQHGQKNVGRRALRRRVQRGQAQGPPHQPVQAFGLAEAGQQFRHAAVKVQAPVHPARTGRKARHRQLVLARQALCPKQRHGQVQRGREARRDEIHGAIGVAHLQRQREQGTAPVDADGCQQPQRGGIGAQQDVLAVVQRAAARLDAARAAAQGAGCLEQRHGAAGARQFDGGRASGPAAADDSDRLLHGRCISCAPTSSTPATACAAASAKSAASARGSHRARFRRGGCGRWRP